MFVFSDHSEEELWKSSFLAAITLHAAVLLTILLAPFFSSNEFTLPKAYTVNLVAMPTAAPPAPALTTPPAKPQPVTPAEPKPLPPDTPKPTAETITPPAPSVAPVPRAVSLTPMKTKKWLTPKKQARELVRQEELHTKRLLTAQKNEEIANEAEQKAARTAVADLRALIRTREMLQNSPAPAPAAAANDTGNAATDGVLASTLFEQYQADVYRKIQQHWILPPLQDWEDSLIAVVVMRVREDGSLADLFFEKKSPNTFFNQFVMNTVRQAAPMPPFPEKMSLSSMEFGLRFSPGGLL